MFYLCYSSNTISLSNVVRLTRKHVLTSIQHNTTRRPNENAIVHKLKQEMAQTICRHYPINIWDILGELPDRRIVFVIRVWRHDDIVICFQGVLDRLHLGIFPPSAVNMIILQTLNDGREQRSFRNVFFYDYQHDYFTRGLLWNWGSVVLSYLL
jgi:hypothetical protein